MHTNRFTRISRVRRSPHTVSVIQTCLALVVCLCACQAQLAPTHPPTPTPRPIAALEPVTITFGFPDRTMEDTYRDLLEDFHREFPYIGVELAPGFEGRQANLAGESAPDTSLEWPSAIIVQSDHLLDLTPVLSEHPSLSEEDFYNAPLRFMRRDGRLLALPADLEIMVLYYNKAIFDDLRLPYPAMDWTWDDFLETAKDVAQASDGTVHGFASNPASWDVVSFVYQHGGRLLDDPLSPTDFYLDDRLLAEAIQWYADLALVHQVMLIPEQTGWGQMPLAEVYRQEVAMWLGFLTDRGGIHSPPEWPFEWGMAPLPRGAQASTFFTARGYVINSNAPHPEECWEWIAYLSSQSATLGLPARRSVAASEETAQRLGPEPATVALNSVSYADLLPITASANITRILGPFLLGVDKVVRGEVTVQEMLGELRPIVEEFRAQAAP